MNEIETDYTTFVTCPHCGYVNRDGWELFVLSEEECIAECDECGKEYRVRQDISVSYTTEKVEP
jgi:DNA-directed RNA polymerase subunit M/transcription elongation factor TFIIS